MFSTKMDNILDRHSYHLKGLSQPHRYPSAATVLSLSEVRDISVN